MVSKRELTAKLKYCLLGGFLSVLAERAAE